MKAIAALRCWKQWRRVGVGGTGFWGETGTIAPQLLESPTSKKSPISYFVLLFMCFCLSFFEFNSNEIIKFIFSLFALSIDFYFAPQQILRLPPPTLRHWSEVPWYVSVLCQHSFVLSMELSVASSDKVSVSMPLQCFT